jgi:organic hydroperoxide reductase OsmC/OhrA
MVENAASAHSRTGSGKRAPFPHVYDVTVSGAGDAAMISATPRPDIEGGAPDTFGGRADWWSPEHLLLASLGLCLKTTFDSFAAREGLRVHGYASRVQAMLDKGREGLTFTSFDIEVELQVEADQTEAARAAMASAKRWCLVSNALKTPVALHVDFRTVSP